MHTMRMEGGEKDVLVWGYDLGFDVSVAQNAFLSSAISLTFHPVCYICSPLQHARAMTEGKDRGRGGGNLSKCSVLERKQDFIKILAEHRLVLISRALSG